jgi:hypothetical protein
MAYILGSRLLTDSDDFKNIPLGLSLPIKYGKQGYFDVNYLSTEQIKTNISNLLRTKEGERVMYPNFGTGLHSLLFNNIDGDLETQIISTIENAFQTWLPYVSLDSIDVDISPEMIDQNKVGIQVNYTLTDNIETESVFFTIEG